MAEEAVRQLVALQPQGPYLLGGYCHGGPIAYEMAQQMERQGLRVGMVILLDAWVPRHFGRLKALIRFGGRLAKFDVDAQTRLYARLRMFLVRASNVHRDGLRTFLSLCWRTARAELQRLAGATPEARGIPGPAFDDPEAPLADLRYRRILMNYRPKPYSGRVVLLRTQAAQISYTTDLTAGWGKLAAHVEVHNLPGDHITCQTEHVGDVAEHTAKYLRAYHREAERLFSPAAGGCRFA
jgi:thioesterase domain-containing protein